MPDSPESRIRWLEGEVAGLKQHAIDVDLRMKELLPTREAQIRLEGKVENVLDDISDIRSMLTARDDFSLRKLGIIMAAIVGIIVGVLQAAAAIIGT